MSDEKQRIAEIVAQFAVDISKFITPAHDLSNTNLRTLLNAALDTVMYIERGNDDGSMPVPTNQSTLMELIVWETTHLAKADREIDTQAQKMESLAYRDYPEHGDFLSSTMHRYLKEITRVAKAIEPFPEKQSSKNQKK